MDKEIKQHPLVIEPYKTYKEFIDIKTKNKPTRPNNALDGAEGNNHSCIFQTIIKRITDELWLKVWIN